MIILIYRRLISQIVFLLLVSGCTCRVIIHFLITNELMCRTPCMYMYKRGEGLLEVYINKPIMFVTMLLKVLTVFFTDSRLIATERSITMMAIYVQLKLPLFSLDVFFLNFSLFIHKMIVIYCGFVYFL